MHIYADTLDDLLRRTFQKVLKSGINISATKGSSVEINGVLLELKNPRARLSRTEARGKLFSCVGEFLWYLAGSNELDFISYYIPMYKKFSDDGKTIHGAYGPRLFNEKDEHNQVKNIIELLKRKRTSRQAVIQLFDSSDIIAPHKDIPCTCTLQFMVRNDRLNMFTNMRSNDAFLGLPHDIFAFTMLQEIIARSLNIDIGIYKHSVGSLHLYEDKIEEAKRFIEEGWQSNIYMPEMPVDDPWESIKKILKLEKNIRLNEDIDSLKFELPDYWKDIVTILKIFSLSKQNKNTSAAIDCLSIDTYRVYLQDRLANSIGAK